MFGVWCLLDGFSVRTYHVVEIVDGWYAGCWQRKNIYVKYYVLNFLFFYY